MKDSETLNHKQKSILRFILIARLFDLQLYTFNKSVSGKFKQRLNNFTANLNQVVGIFKSQANPEVEEYLDNISATAWEVIDELAKAQDPAMFLTVCRAYNAGLITASEEGIPVNAPEFPGMLAEKSLTEKAA